MVLFLSFALKNIFRNKWRSIFVVGLLVVGIMVLFFSVSLNESAGGIMKNLNNITSGYDANLSAYSDLNGSPSMYSDYSDLNSSLISSENYSNSSLLNTSNTNLSNNLTGINAINSTYNITQSKDSMIEAVNVVCTSLVIVSIVVGAIIIMIAMLKAVGERTREIGVLKSIGWTNNRVSALILLESIFQLLIAWVIFMVLFLIMYFLHMQGINNLIFNILHWNMTSIYKVFGLTFLSSLFIPIIGTLIPLLKAFRIKPSEAMRYE